MSSLYLMIEKVVWSGFLSYGSVSFKEVLAPKRNQMKNADYIIGWMFYIFWLVKLTVRI